MSRRSPRQNRRKARSGTSSSSVFAANYYRGATTKRQKGRHGNKSHILAAAGAIAATVIALVVIFYFGKVNQVEVVGVESSDDRTALEEYMFEQYSYLWQPLFSSLEPSDLPSSATSVRLESDWTEQTLIVSALGSNEQMQEPVVIWQSNNELFGVSGQGFTVEESHDGLPIINDESNLDVEMGDRVGPDSFIEFVLDVEASTLEVEEYRVMDTTRELYADLNGGYYVRFDTEGDANLQLDNVERVQSQADSIDQYIDVRIPFKAYYR